ncbi:hypothetical protein ACFQY7_14150 [Actinomadura luteofluorescens]|uniref:hypothetical protein n=1 Tax=Actinomadura luteofluorescens TaxID=46163 RepID=UPI003625BE78
MFFAAIGVGVLLYPAGRLEGAAARLWTAAAVVIMVGGQALLCAVSRPAWNGFAASVAWPALRPEHEVFHGVQRGLAAAMTLLAGALVVILVARLPRTGRLDRALTVPVAVAVTFGVSGALVVQSTLIGSDAELADVLDVYLFQGVFATVLPLAFLGTALRARLAELTVAERMQRLLVGPSRWRASATRSAPSSATAPWTCGCGRTAATSTSTAAACAPRPPEAPRDAGGTGSARPAASPSPPSTSTPRSATTSRSSRRRWSRAAARWRPCASRPPRRPIWNGRARRASVWCASRRPSASASPPT